MVWRYFRIFGLYKNKEFKGYGNFQNTYIRAHGARPALLSGTLPASRLPQAEPVDRFPPHTAGQPPCTGNLGQNADIHAGASTAHSRGAGRTIKNSSSPKAGSIGNGIVCTRQRNGREAGNLATEIKVLQYRPLAS